MLKHYYSQLYEVIQRDITMMLEEPDLTKRSPKVILSYLEMAQTCLDHLTDQDSATAGWDELTEKQQVDITAIIEGSTHEA